MSRSSPENRTGWPAFFDLACDFVANAPGAPTDRHAIHATAIELVGALLSEGVIRREGDELVMNTTDHTTDPTDVA